MTEALFQFIWKHSLYNPTGLKSTSGEDIQVVFSGNINKDSGPDFSEARIRVGNTLLIGNVELHINASDFQKHGHLKDNAYSNLILHVVYNNDLSNFLPSTPTLVLKEHLSDELIKKYDELLVANRPIPCGEQHLRVRDITKESWQSRLLAERWEQKLLDWNVMLENSAEDWRNLLYWRLGANFGFKTNADAFLTLVRSIPLNVLARHRENLMQIEALLFGQAGMLNEPFKDEYPTILQNEYYYLSKKYSLTPMPVHLWKFLRMRPANFPTIRIAQFAKLIHESVHLFSKLIASHSVKEVEAQFNISASDYWDNHFVFDEEVHEVSPKKLGKTSIQNIVINTIAPIQFLYASKQDTGNLAELAIQLLDTVKAEENHIISYWEQVGWKPKNASQSQALLQLYKCYCSQKKCLQCAIGLQIIKQAK